MLQSINSAALCTSMQHAYHSSRTIPLLLPTLRPFVYATSLPTCPARPAAGRAVVTGTGGAAAAAVIAGAAAAAAAAGAGATTGAAAVAAAAAAAGTAWAATSHAGARSLPSLQVRPGHTEPYGVYGCRRHKSTRFVWAGDCCGYVFCCVGVMNGMQQARRLCMSEQAAGRALEKQC
jgi:hypothetical protein